MNQKNLHLTLAVALVGGALAAGNAFSQGTYGGTTPSTPAASSMDKGTTGTTMDKGTTTGAAMTPSKSEMASSAFTKLDASKRGYVTKADVAQLQGFDSAFQQADTNNDGKLSKDEFDRAWAIYSGHKQ